jgi:hypothetical protein
MSTPEKGKGADEELFHSLTPEPESDKSANIQLIIILVGVALLVAAGLVWYELKPTQTPIEAAVSRLHAGMERLDVVTALGHETHVDKLPGELDAACSSAYKVEGASQPVFVGYKPVKSGEACPHYSDQIVQWCIYAGEAAPGAPGKTIPPTDANGQPLKLVCHALN